MIILSRAEIEALVDLDAGLHAVEQAYIAASQGRATIPPVGYIAFPQADGDCHIKYGHIAGDPIFVVKIASGFYRNPSIGLSTSSGVMLALSATTGQLQAILLDEGFLTDLRTGLGGAIATRALCRKDARRVAIIGSGIQAGMQIRCLHRAMKDRSLTFALWARSKTKAAGIVETLAEEGIAVELARNLEALCRSADTIITTTPSREPLVCSDWIRPGTHITAIGADAPGKQELETALVARADHRIADRLEQSLAHGEFSTAFEAGAIMLESCRELGAVLDGAVKGRQNQDEITIADLTGIAVQDIAITRAILDAHRRT
ncbi:ornithine cyclodeaminase family protein [Rhizobium sp. 32-5/1]|uniref:ornithine cyclodeaminase family protein n=1 Tax=Rhizobium sp. 32-5/1 TaxID=3019602 RepID=UPI00240DA1F5|nr:ornithine cyclodeaminase family protein [Rhizobium sp. 32-5/1]WEZ82391.1 ornithine cyclodeaminase family protein [Rhizobium sp. 32-5/1]